MYRTPTNSEYQTRYTNEMTRITETAVTAEHADSGAANPSTAEVRL